MASHPLIYCRNVLSHNSLRAYLAPVCGASPGSGEAALARSPCEVHPSQGRKFRHAATLLAAILGCAPAFGAAPLVDSFSLTPRRVPPGGTVALAVAAHDPDCAGTCASGCGQTIRADLTLWSADGGSFTDVQNGTTGSPYAAGAVWQAPAVEGTYTLRVRLSDSGSFLCGGRQTTEAQQTVLVTTSLNQPPSVDAVDAAPAQLYTGGTSLLTCAGSDPDRGDILTYSWSASAGVLEPVGPQSVRLQADRPGLVTVTCTATDPFGAHGVGATQVSVTDAFALPALSDGLRAPRRLAVDSSGSVFVVDGGELSVLSLFSGRWLARVQPAAGEGDDARPFTPTSVAVDWDDRLLIGAGDGAVLVERDGTFVRRFATGDALGAVSDVAVDTQRRRHAVLYSAAGRVEVFDDAGALVTQFGSTGDAPAQVKSPLGLAFTPEGRVVVADSGHGVLKLFELDGTLVRTMGQPGAGVGRFVRLDDVAVDGRGVIYASDAFQSWVQAFDPDGSLREVLGTYGAGRGQFMTAAGIAGADAFGVLLAASVNSSSLQVFRFQGPDPQPRLGMPAASPARLEFPAQALELRGQTLAVTLGNAGRGLLGLRGIAVSGPFTHTHDCPESLAPGATCVVRVTFRPQAPGEAEGALVLRTSGEPAELDVPLRGAAFATPVLLPDPPRLEFSDQWVGTVSKPLRVSLRNAGTLPLTVTGVAVSGDFGLASECLATLPGGAECTLEVLFAPTRAGDTLTGLLRVDSTAAGSPLLVPLEGRGVLLELDFQPASVDFGSVQPGAQAVRRVTVTNRGTDFLVLGKLLVEGESAAELTLSLDECGDRRLEVGEACHVDVRFRPEEPRGPRSARLVVPSRAPNGPGVVKLAGYSGTPEGALIFADGFESGDASAWSQAHPELEARLSFPAGEEAPRLQRARIDVRSGGRRLQRVSVANDGPQPLVLGMPWLEGAPVFALAADGCGGRALAAGHVCELTLGFASEQPGAWQAELRIPAEDGRTAVLVLEGRR